MTPWHWVLRRQLRRAASLLEDGVITKEQYSSFCIDIGQKLLGQPVEYEMKINYFTFGAGLSEALVRDPSSEAALRRLLKEYGPYNEATLTIRARDPDN